MEDGYNSRGQGTELANLARLRIERLASAQLLRLHLVVLYLVGPHTADDFLSKAVESLLDPRQDPWNPEENFERRLIQVIQSIPLPKRGNRADEDLEAMELLVKGIDNNLVAELFKALRCNLSVDEFHQHKDRTSEQEHQDAMTKLRMILGNALQKGGTSGHW
jgi:hypothetical protein